MVVDHVHFYSLRVKVEAFVIALGDFNAGHSCWDQAIFPFCRRMLAEFFSQFPGKLFVPRVPGAGVVKMVAATWPGATQARF